MTTLPLFNSHTPTPTEEALIELLACRLMDMGDSTEVTESLMDYTHTLTTKVALACGAVVNEETQAMEMPEVEGPRLVGNRDLYRAILPLLDCTNPSINDLVSARVFVEALDDLNEDAGAQKLLDLIHMHHSRVALACGATIDPDTQTAQMPPAGEDRSVREQVALNKGLHTLITELNDRGIPKEDDYGDPIDLHDRLILLLDGLDKAVGLDELSDCRRILSRELAEADTLSVSGAAARAVTQRRQAEAHLAEVGEALRSPGEGQPKPHNFRQMIEALHRRMKTAETTSEAYQAALESAISSVGFQASDDNPITGIAEMSRSWERLFVESDQISEALPPKAELKATTLPGAVAEVVKRMKRAEAELKTLKASLNKPKIIVDTTNFRESLEAVIAPLKAAEEATPPTDPDTVTTSCVYCENHINHQPWCPVRVAAREGVTVDSVIKSRMESTNPESTP